MSLIPSLQKVNIIDLKQKKCSPGHNLLFDLIVIPSEAFFIFIDEFLDVSGVPHQVLFEKISQLFSDFLHHEKAVLPRSHAGQAMCEYWRVEGLESMPHGQILSETFSSVKNQIRLPLLVLEDSCWCCAIVVFLITI